MILKKRKRSSRQENAGINSVFRALDRGKAALRKKENPEEEALLLLAHALGEDPYRILSQDLAPDLSALERYESFLDLRASGVPFAYIKEEKEFFGMPLHVGPGVLIPRPETESLIDLILSAPPKKGGVILDLGTGSGAILRALHETLGGGYLYLGIEKYPAALAWARRNISSPLHLLRGDRISMIRSESVDLLVSNPPYLSDSDMEGLSDETKHEPQTAIYGGGDGSEFIESLLPDVRRVLRPGGRGYFEVNPSFVNDHFLGLLELIFDSVRVKDDLEGRSRFILVSKIQHEAKCRPLKNEIEKKRN